MQIVVKSIWITAIVLLSLAAVWYLLGSTAFFQRGIDLLRTVIFIIVWAPAILLIWRSIVLLREGWMPSSFFSQVGLVVAIILATLILVPTLVLNASIYGWLRESVTRDWPQITDDGRFEYRVELVNRWQRNNRTRLHVVDLSTGEEIIIPLDISTDDINGGGEGSRTPVPEDVSPHAMAELTPTEIENIYMLTTRRTHRGTVVISEINMVTETAVRLFTERQYRSSSRRISEEGQYRYTYILLLIDRYQNGDIIKTEILLEIIKHEAGSRHFIILPVDAELLKKDNLRQLDRASTPLWVAMEPTDTPSQFIVQTTEELSEEITLTFLVDIELGVIE